MYLTTACALFFRGVQRVLFECTHLLSSTTNWFFSFDCTQYASYRKKSYRILILAQCHFRPQIKLSLWGYTYTVFRHLYYYNDAPERNYFAFCCAYKRVCSPLSCSIHHPQRGARTRVLTLLAFVVGSPKWLQIPPAIWLPAKLRIAGLLPCHASGYPNTAVSLHSYSKHKLCAPTTVFNYGIHTLKITFSGK